MKPGLRVQIATVGFQVRRITEPLIRERSDKVYLTHSKDDKAAAYLEKIMKIIRKVPQNLEEGNEYQGPF
jgi:hypothetical protein